MSRIGRCTKWIRIYPFLEVYPQKEGKFGVLFSLVVSALVYETRDPRFLCSLHGFKFLCSVNSYIPNCLCFGYFALAGLRE